MLKASLFRRSFLLYVGCMIKAIIFDFDGVIVLSEQGRFSALQHLGKRYGIQISDDLFRKIIGRTTHDFFELNFPDLDADKLQKLMHDYQVEYKDRVIDHVVPIAFTNEFIRSYHGNKWLAVASGSDTRVLDTLLKHLGLHDKFARIVGKEHVTKHKPDPEAYLYTAKELGLSPAECVVVEDTAVGAEAANNAGMKVFALLNGINAKDDFESVRVEGYIADLTQLQEALDC